MSQEYNNTLIKNIWEAMRLPEFIQNKIQNGILYKVKIQENNQVINLRFDNSSDIELLSKKIEPINKTFYFNTLSQAQQILEQNLTQKTKSIWYPEKSHWGNSPNYHYDSEEHLMPEYPIYIVSKNRAKRCLTSKALTELNVKHYIVVEEFNLKEYQENNTSDLITFLILPEKYRTDYDLCGGLGGNGNPGPGAARNFARQHSIDSGFKYHWVMDDNLQYFSFLNRNEKLLLKTPTFLKVAEDLFTSFENAPVCGLNYLNFCKKIDKANITIPNTRIYSCLFIDNSSGYSWRGQYNEDTDLSLSVLKDGNCTIQLNAFLCEKITTQRMRGGNSEEFYDAEGTYNKSKIIEELHPDVAYVTEKFGRIHHHVNYKKFYGNKLVPKKNLRFPEYNITLRNSEGCIISLDCLKIQNSQINNVKCFDEW